MPERSVHAPAGERFVPYTFGAWRWGWLLARGCQSVTQRTSGGKEGHDPNGRRVRERQVPPTPCWGVSDPTHQHPQTTDRSSGRAGDVRQVGGGAAHNSPSPRQPHVSPTSAQQLLVRPPSPECEAGMQRGVLNSEGPSVQQPPNSEDQCDNACCCSPRTPTGQPQPAGRLPPSHHHRPCGANRIITAAPPNPSQRRRPRPSPQPHRRVRQLHEHAPERHKLGVHVRKLVIVPPHLLHLVLWAY